jgi:transposase
MPKTKPAYPPDFRVEAVRLAQSGQQSIAQTARNLGVSYEALRGWMKRADLDAGRRNDGLTSVERDELARLRRENRVLKEEREILKKAAAFFATGPKGHPATR